MRKLGIERVILVSGDIQKTADEIGKQINANEVIAECSPEQKLELVRREMKQDSKSVILVGDGINDAPALAAASVGVAMGARGATAASEAADVVIIEDSISHLAYAIDISQGAYSKAKQAGLIGMSLSIAAMLSAAFGVLNPTQAAITQEVIDVAAILWALTPLTSKLKRNWPKPKPGPTL
jgi:P-type E1-E2 ATPase